MQPFRSGIEAGAEFVMEMSLSRRSQRITRQSDLME